MLNNKIPHQERHAQHQACPFCLPPHKFFSKNFVCTNIHCTFAIVLLPKSCFHVGFEGGNLYIGKALLDALCLILRNLTVSTNRSNIKATMTSIRCIFSTPICNNPHGALCKSVVYILMRGLLRCSFNRLGNVRASKCGASNRIGFHAFFVYMNKPTKKQREREPL